MKNSMMKTLRIALALLLVLSPLTAYGQRPVSPLISGATSLGESKTLLVASTGAVTLSTGTTVGLQRPVSQMVSGATSDGIQATLLVDADGALVVSNGLAGTCANTRVVYGTGTNTFACDAGMTYVAGTDALTVAGSITDGGLTSGRVTFAGTGGLLSDDAGLTYDAGTEALTVVGPIAGAAISGTTGAFSSTISGTAITATTGTAGSPNFATSAGNGMYADGTGNYLARGAATVFGWNTTAAAFADNVEVGWSTGAISSMDTAFSRISAGVIGVGTGAAGSTAGSLSGTTLTGSTSLKTLSFRSLGDVELFSTGGNVPTFKVGASFEAGLSSTLYQSATNCSDSAGDAACGSAAAGSVVVDAADTATVVSTTAVTANSQVVLQIDAGLGTRLGVTCNTQAGSVFNPRVTARTAATSFTITVDAGPTTNPLCLSYWVVN
jgi:fibronectin-binding autotransporter adhesin